MIRARTGPAARGGRPFLLFIFIWLLAVTRALPGAAQSTTPPGVAPGGGAPAPAAVSPVLSRILSRGEIRVGVNPLFKPFSFEQEGKRVGVDIDIANLLAEKLGVKARIVVPAKFGDLIGMVARGEVDVVMAGMSITFPRALKVDFTRPYFDTGLSILANKGRLARLGAPRADSYEALRDTLRARGRMGRLRIAVTRGKAPEKVVPRFFPGAQVVAFDSNEKAAAAVLRGEADIMVHDEMFLKVWLHDNAARARFLLTVFDRPFKPDHYGMAVARGDLEFVHLLDTFILTELRANGRLMEFLNRYIPVKAQVSVRSYAITEDYYGGD